MSFVDFLGSPDVWKAVGAAVAGGGLLKYVESWLTRSRYKSEQDKAFRDEKRQEADALRKRIEELQIKLREAELEIDDWRLKYWGIYSTYQQYKLNVYAILLENGIKPVDVLPKEESSGSS